MKSKLPFLKKDKNETLDESEETTGLTDISDLESEDDESSENIKKDNSLVNKLKAKLTPLNKKKSAAKKSDDDDEDEEDSEEEKKKKRGKIIRIAIVGALVVFLASDYIFPPDEDTAVPEVPPVAKKVRAPKVEEPADTTAEVPTTPAVEEIPDTVVDTPKTPPVEDLPDTVVDTPVAPRVAEDSSSTTYTPDDSPVDITSDDVGSTPVPDPVSPDTLYGEDNSVSDFGTPDVTGGDDFTDQILQDLEKQATPTKEKVVVKKYVAPPDYDYRGRGLVYNCQGKHWACVDAPSYKICEDNASSTEFLNKPTECHPFNVYETVRGCEITQNRMVSSSAKTKFCNN